MNTFNSPNATTFQITTDSVPIILRLLCHTYLRGYYQNTNISYHLVSTSLYSAKSLDWQFVPDIIPIKKAANLSQRINEIELLF